MSLIFLFLKGLDALALEEAAVRVALIHTAFFITGGGERLLLEMYRALKDLSTRSTYMPPTLTRGPGR